jgi:hypothetical protein
LLESVAEEKEMLSAYLRISFPEDFISKRIKHGNQRTEEEEMLSYRLCGSLKLFFFCHSQRTSVSRWCCVLIKHHFSLLCTFLIAVTTVDGLFHWVGVASCIGQHQIDLDTPTENRIRQDHDKDFSVSLSTFPRKYEREGKTLKTADLSAR